MTTSNEVAEQVRAALDAWDGTTPGHRLPLIKSLQANAYEWLRALLDENERRDNEWTDLRQRLVDAYTGLGIPAVSDPTIKYRMEAKREGVKLALSYMDDVDRRAVSL